MKKTILFLTIFFCLTSASFARADILGQTQKFFVEPGYDAQKRSQINAVLIDITPQFYVYADQDWWSFSPQGDALKAVQALGDEFNNKIYPKLTSTFGSEPNPGIDKDPKMTLLIEPMSGEDGGYFRSSDGYPKLQITTSNEREMLYLSADYISTPFAKSFLAHEFTHLITFNQKENKNNVSEDIWLDEARAEYAPTLLGYDDVYSGSYLEKRVQYFSEQPSASLVDFKNTKYDYARVSLFVHYLVDQYGINILSDSLKSKLTGVASINYALQKNGFKEDFSKIFSDWTVAVLINDCDYGPKYCYSETGLKDFSLLPQVNFLPISGESTLTFAENTTYWAGNWYKIIGGGIGTMKFNFVGDPKVPFTVYYITKNRVGAYNINTLSLDKLQKGQVNISDFGNDIISLFIIPQLQGSISGDTLPHSFSWSASVVKNSGSDPAQNNPGNPAQNGNTSGQNLCSKLNNNLYFGMVNNSDVKCLQQLLKNQGISIYPEGYVTGNFATLTKAAVIRFQEKYTSEILTPLGLSRGTGYVGAATRTKINQILNGG